MGHLKYEAGGRPQYIRSLTKGLKLDKLFPEDDPFAGSVRDWCMGEFGQLFDNDDPERKEMAGRELQLLVRTWLQQPHGDPETEAQTKARKELDEQLQTILNSVGILEKGATSEGTWDKAIAALSTDSLKKLRECVKNYNDATGYSLSAEPEMQALNGLVRGLTVISDSLEQKAADESAKEMYDNFQRMQTEGKNFESALQNLQENAVIDGRPVLVPGSSVDTVLKKVSDEAAAAEQEIENQRAVIPALLKEKERAEQEVRLQTMYVKYLTRKEAEKKLDAFQKRHAEGVWKKLSGNDLADFLRAEEDLELWNYHTSVIQKATESGQLVDREKREDMVDALARDEYRRRKVVGSIDGPRTLKDCRTDFEGMSYEKLTEKVEARYDRAKKRWSNLVGRHPEIKAYFDQIGSSKFTKELHDMCEAVRADMDKKEIREEQKKLNNEVQSARNEETDAAKELKIHMKGLNLDARVDSLCARLDNSKMTKEQCLQRRKELSEKALKADAKYSHAEHYIGEYVENLQKKADYLNDVKTRLEKTKGNIDFLTEKFPAQNMKKLLDVFSENTKFHEIHENAKASCGHKRIDTIGEQLKEMYARVDEAHKDGHENTPEFTAMKQSLENIFGTNKSGKPTAADLKTMREAAEHYLREKEGGIHLISSPMRQYRIAFAKELAALAEQGEKAFKKVDREEQKLRELNQDFAALSKATDSAKLNTVVMDRIKTGEKETFPQYLDRKLKAMNRNLETARKAVVEVVGEAPKMEAQPAQKAGLHV